MRMWSVRSNDATSAARKGAGQARGGGAHSQCWWRRRRCRPAGSRGSWRPRERRGSSPGLLRCERRTRRKLAWLSCRSPSRVRCTCWTRRRSCTRAAEGLRARQWGRPKRTSSRIPYTRLWSRCSNRDPRRTMQPRLQDRRKTHRERLHSRHRRSRNRIRRGTAQQRQPLARILPLKQATRTRRPDETRQQVRR